MFHFSSKADMLLKTIIDFFAPIKLDYDLDVFYTERYKQNMTSVLALRPYSSVG